MSESLYLKSDVDRISELNNIVPEEFKKFYSFNISAFSAGTLSKKTKELIAIAVSHTNGSAHSIERHVKNAKKHGVNKNEMAEVIMVAAALKAGSVAAHSVNALNAYDDKGEEELYKKEYFNRFPEMMELDPKGFKSFIKFDTTSLNSNELDVKTKELIAVAVAHITGCPYCIEDHVKASKRIGVTKEELAESIMVAIASNAESVLFNSANALNAFD